MRRGARGVPDRPGPTKLLTRLKLPANQARAAAPQTVRARTADASPDTRTLFAGARGGNTPRVARLRWPAARRRSARVPRWAADHDRGSMAGLKIGAPHILSAHTASAAVSRNRRGVRLKSGPRRLPAADETSSRPTRHPVQTPARRGRCGLRLTDAAVGSRADVWTRCIPAATRLRRAQVDVADHSERRPPRRFRDTSDRPACADKTCGAPIFSPATTLTRGERLGIHRGRASASSGRAAASSVPPGGGQQPPQPGRRRAATTTDRREQPPRTRRKPPEAASMATTSGPVREYRAAEDDASARCLRRGKLS